MPTKGFWVAGKSGVWGVFLGAAAGVWFGAGAAWGACAGDGEVAGEWIFEPEADVPGWAVNSGGDGDWGNLGLMGGAGFSTNVPGVNCGCGHSLELPGTNGAAGAVSVGSYDPLAGAEKFSVMAWVRRGSEAGENLSARVFSDADSTALADTTAGVEFRFSGSAGNLALRINGTEVATTVGGVAPESGEWHHVAAVYDGTRAATNYTTRNVHFYVDGIQRGVGSVLQNAVVATNDAPVAVGNASASRTAANLLAGNVDDVLVLPGWAPDAAGNGNANAAIQCFMEGIDDIFPPYILPPPDIEAEADECLAPVAVELGTPTVGDDCLVASVTNDAPVLFPPGTNVVTWTVRDEAGNTATCTQTVTVVPSSMWDCDGDGWTDGEEVAAGTEAVDSLSAPRLARGVLLHAVKYSAAQEAQWIQLHCSGPRAVDVSGFRIQVAGTDWETQATLPQGTWMRPGHFLLVGGENVEGADVTAELDLSGSYANLPTSGVRLMAPDNSTNAPVDVLMYGTHVPFNAQGLDTTGWLSETTNLWASPSRHLERWHFGLDTDLENDWRHTEDGEMYNAGETLDSDGDGLPDEEEFLVGFNPLDPDTDSDGLLDSFEFAEGLSPVTSDTDGDGISDGAEMDVATGLTYADKQEAQGLTLDTTGPEGWTQGGDLGWNNSVDFKITDVEGFAVWGIIWEGGGIGESYTVDVTGSAMFATWAKKTKNGHTNVNVFAVPDGTNAMVVTVTDGGPNPRVTNSNDFGADIRAAFRAVALDIEAGGVDETHEEAPGVFLPDKTIHTNAQRTVCRLSVNAPLPKMSPPVPGTLSMTWEDCGLRVYSEDMPDGGTPLPALILPLDGFAATNLWLEAFATTNTLLVWRWNDQTNGQDVVTATGVRLFLTDVDFRGTKCHTIKRDDGIVNYNAPQWQDNSTPNDGDVDDPDDIKWPVCFTRNTKMTLSAYWMFQPVSPSWNILVKGDGPDGLNFPATNAIVDVMDIVYVQGVECAVAFTNSVAYYPSLEIKWSFSMDGGSTWLDAGISANPVYVTLGDPLTTNLYHTLVHLGCSNAAGKTAALDVADAIYFEFTDCCVRRTSDHLQMTYWAGDLIGGQETGTLLASADGNGNCQAWSAFLRDCFRVQGIPADRMRARPISLNDYGIMVKNWSFVDSPSGTGMHPYRLGLDATDLPGIPGQGNPNPPGIFNGHWITECCGYYYDPSYGTPKVGGGGRDKQYEDNSLDGFVDVNLNWSRKNNTNAVSVSEMKYETNN